MEEKKTERPALKKSLLLRMERFAGTFMTGNKFREGGVSHEQP